MRILSTAIYSTLILALAVTLTGCLLLDLLGSPGEFSMQVTPESIDDAIPGQRCVFLVTVQNEGIGAGAVNISAAAEGASVTVTPQAITSGQVAEVTVIPDDLVMTGTLPDIAVNDADGRPPIIGPVEPEPYMGETLTVVVTGERSGLEQTAAVTVVVSTGPDDIAPYATELRDRFIPWLAENHPELGITAGTQWTDTVVRPNIAVVMYYLFFSEEWEMGLRWHVMIPPHDWAEIYLRHRTTEVMPSYAFKITSLTAGDDPQAVTPPESVWR